MTLLEEDLINVFETLIEYAKDFANELEESPCCITLAQSLLAQFKRERE